MPKNNHNNVMWRPELLAADRAERIRYIFGTTGGEISGEKTRKRRSTKHLKFLRFFFEGRRSILLSYGRVACIDSKSIIASTSIILKALTPHRPGRRSIQAELQANVGSISSSCSYLDLFKRSKLDSRSIQSNGCFLGRKFKAQPHLSP
jgi:hypothetical protein